jgi:hypothetical protein
VLFGIGLFERLDEVGFLVEVAGALGELGLGDAVERCLPISMPLASSPMMS